MYSDQILCQCAESVDFATKLTPVYIWENSKSSHLQKYAELLKNDPQTLMYFCHKQEVVMHALSLNIVPAEEFVMTI